MTIQQSAEIDYWMAEFRRHANPDDFVDVRRGRDLSIEAEYVPEIFHEPGLGLDLACGFVSVLEGLRDARIIAIDALWPSYSQLHAWTPRPGVEYGSGDGENLEFVDASFDFVWCQNAIDHTPNPKRMLAEILRVLKPGGNFYFLVNFDPSLYAPHYHLWNMRMVEEHLAEFRLERGTLFFTRQWGNKYVWSARYSK